MERILLTNGKIEEYFSLKKDVRNIRTIEGAQSLVDKYGILVDSATLQEAAPITYRKLFVSAYFDQKMPLRYTELQHFDVMKENVNVLVTHLNDQKSTSAVWVGGSFANGKPSGKFSDLDLYFGMRNTSQLFEKQKEINIFQNLDGIGIVINNKTKALKAVEEVISRGKGVARIDAMTRGGVEVDIHCLGELDLRRMPLLFPGKIRRLDSIEPYTQLRVSFTGERKQVSVGEQFINNYFTDKVPVKGIYLDNLSASGVLVHDHKEYGRKISEQIWMAIVKGYIYYNNGYIRNKTGKVVAINSDALSFRNFLQTLYYQQETSYSPERLSYLKEQYNVSLLQIQIRFNLI